MTQRTGNSNGDARGNMRKTSSENERVVDFTEMREKRLVEKRRNNERVFFKNLLSVFTVTGNGKVHPIEVIEVSEEGLSFHVPANQNSSWLGKIPEIPIRLYFSRDTYLEVLVRIVNSRPAIEKGERYTRYGCSVDPETKSYPTYQLFVKFLKLYSENSHKDMGDVTAFYR